MFKIFSNFTENSKIHRKLNWAFPVNPHVEDINGKV